MGEAEIPKELIAGKYRLTRLLGRGGMGSVWEGVHNSLGTRVACKFIETEYASSEEARSRFENEARAAASLRSKHVVEVYDHGVSPDGRPYIVMEYLAGEPLDTRLERSGRLSLQDTAKIITHVSRALSKAHQAGIVHRDLKPENVFLVWDDEDSADIAKVVDFGIAKFTDKSAGISSSTRTGSVLGTPYYMSPEQARGLRTVDYRSDLWSLGVIGFRCVLGRLPFEGEALGDLLVKLCTSPIPIPSQLDPGLPAAFDAWVARALSRDPERGFSDARTMAQELNELSGLHYRPAMNSSVDPDASGPVALFSGGVSTPSPMSSQGTPYPAASAAGAQQLLPANNTNAALTATPPLAIRSSRVPLLAAGAAGLVVVGLGVAVLARSMTAEVGSEPSASLETPAESSLAARAPVVLPVPVQAAEQPALVPLPPVVEPTPAVPAGPTKKTAVSARKPVRPKPAPEPSAVEPPAPEPPVVAKPAPVPQRSAYKPPTTVKKKPGIDVGY